MHTLDRPVWASLSTYHADLSVGGSLARRYRPDINLFASGCDDSLPALNALADLVPPDEQVYVLQVPAIVTPSCLAVVRSATGVQMVATRRADAGGACHDLVALSDVDAAEMLALARLTQPGPFLAGTHLMGRFLGIRIEGRLAAMAGERFRFPGYTEISAVCTHPDHRGKGLARQLSAAVATRIQARGEQPFLHAWKTNVAAISLYESLGFRLRTEVNVAILKRGSSD